MQTTPRFTGMDIADTDDARLLSAAIQQSGLSIEQFARTVIVRDARNVYRWLKGQYALPARVRSRLRELLDTQGNSG